MLKTITQFEIERKARLFSVMGDSTRLSIVVSLVDGEKRSITELRDGFKLSRQAITKHLRILEDAGLVKGEKSGRENLYELKIESLAEGRQLIESLERQWEQTLGRLKSFLEEK